MSTETSDIDLDLSPGQTREQALKLRAILEAQRNQPRLTMKEYLDRRREEQARAARGEVGPTPEQQQKLQALLAAQGKKSGMNAFQHIMEIINSNPPLWESEEEYLAFMASIGRPQSPENAS